MLELWLVSGIPGAGKTTVARMLAAAFERGVHIEGDKIGHEFIVSGLVAPHEEPKEEAQRQLSLRRRNVVSLTKAFLEENFAVVIDDVVVSNRVLDSYKKALLAFRFVQLCPSLETVRARDEGRDKQVFEVWSHLQSHLEGMERVGLWIDSTELSAEQTVEEILRRKEAALLR